MVIRRPNLFSTRLKPALKDNPSADHRFTLQHCQLADAVQFRRMNNLDMCVNLFPNHHFYWGDEHYRLTVGPERAERMNACRNRFGQQCANGHAFGCAGHTAWAFVYGVVRGQSHHRFRAVCKAETEKISVADALYAITMGAAYTLKLDGEVGSIEVGKHADIVVLEDDPEAIGAENLKDVRVWGHNAGWPDFCYG